MVAVLDLLLASKSPRRRELLTLAGLRYESCQPGDEYEAGASEHDSEPGEPRRLAQQRARRKALGAVATAEGTPVLAVDTVVDLDGVELGKAATPAAAAAFLRRLVGQTHAVHTAHCLCLPAHPERVFEEVCTANVRCDAASPEQIERYLASDQWRGKAGAYGIQDSAQDFLHLVEGSFDTVVGLHVPAVQRLLRMLREPS